MKILVFMAFILLTAATCKEKGKTSTKTVKSTKSKERVFIDTKGNHWNAFEKIPPHLRTPEQQLFTKSLTDVLINGVVAENDHMVLKFSKAECLSRGMTEKTYNEIQSNLRVNNHYFDSLGVSKEIPKMIEDMRRDLMAYQARGYQNSK